MSARLSRPGKKRFARHRQRGETRDPRRCRADDLGPLKASVDKEKSIPLPPIVGGRRAAAHH